MAIDVNTISSYVEEKKLPLIKEAVIGNRTAKEFNLMTGVKGATNLNLLETEVSFGNGADCGWDEAGTSTLTKRVLTPGAIKVNMSFCDKKLLGTWANYLVRVAAGQKTLPFEEEFISGVINGVKANLEKAMWQGDTNSGDVNLNKFDGLIKIAANASLANTITFDSSSTIASRVNAVYADIPAEAYTKGAVVLYMGSDDYRKYVQELVANGNLVLNAGSGAVLDAIKMPAEMYIPGTNVIVIPVNGLDGTSKMYASYKDNFVYGVDLAGDEEKIEFWYSQDNREFRLAIEFIAGVQVAYPDMLVAGTL